MGDPGRLAGSAGSGEIIANGRLDSWKEIASYLNRSISTVQRWERQEALPVHRHQHGALGSVYAHRAEVDAWWHERRLRLEKEEPTGTDGEPNGERPASPRAAARIGGLVGLGLLAGIGGYLLGTSGRTPPVTPRPLRRFVVSPTVGRPLSLVERPALALSPDGSLLAYVASHQGGTQLDLRKMDRLDAAPIPGTEGASAPFFSPDGRWLAFFAEGKLKRVPLTGGPAQNLCDAPSNRGGSWAPDGSIVFSPSTNSGLWRTLADGTGPRPLTTPDPLKGEDSHRWPDVLPGGEAVVFTVRTTGSESYDEARIAVASLRTGGVRTLVEGGSHARYSPSGHLVYARAGRLMAVRFDAQRLETIGPPSPVLEGVLVDAGSGAAHFSLSREGALAYVAGGATSDDRRLVWVDRHGTEEPILDAPRPYVWPRLSPDGRRLAFATEGASTDVWAYDLGRGALTRLTFEAGNSFPVWMPDGARLVISSNRAGRMSLFSLAADGSGTTEPLLASPRWQRAGSWSRDGALFVFVEADAASGQDLWALRRGEAAPTPILRTPYLEGGGLLSPDGRWLAYVSDESGRSEVYLTALSGHGAKLQVSSDGGAEPVWAPSGDEVFYRSRDKLMAVAVSLSNGASLAGRPKVLLEQPYVRSLGPYPNYDVAADGRRFVMVKGAAAPATELHVALDWLSILPR